MASLTAVTQYDLLAAGTNRNASIQTAQIALDANQDLSLVKVRINTEQLKGADGHTVRIYDIWTEGTYTGGVTEQVSLLVQKVVLLLIRLI